MTKKIDNDDIDMEDLENESDDSQKDSKKKKIYMNYYEKNDKLKKELDDIGFPERGSKSILEKRSLNEFTDRRKKKKKLRRN